ncbi:MAG TPA: hypothetical protein VFR37_07955 [Longimicrobium sp.]|nr:hypothetical protein [Longimicrobium sp.]
MSAGERIPLAQAKEIAAQCMGDLGPVVKRALVAGSIRREREMVGDVEIVAEPLDVSDLLGNGEPDVESVRRVAHRWGTPVKNGSKFIQVRRPDGVHVDLWLVTPPAEWWCIVAIRTGPAELGRHVVTRMQTRGYKHDGGHVLRAGQRVPVPDEDAFFSFAGLPCLPPNQRDGDAAMRAVR